MTPHLDAHRGRQLMPLLDRCATIAATGGAR
jgi:hypothetical protein